VIFLIALITKDRLLFTKLIEAQTACAVATNLDFANVETRGAVKKRAGLAV
jgi:hypothetical protein